MTVIDFLLIYAVYTYLYMMPISAYLSRSGYYAAAAMYLLLAPLMYPMVKAMKDLE